MKVQMHTFSNFPNAFASLVSDQVSSCAGCLKLWNPIWLCPPSPILDMCAHGNHDIHSLEEFAMLFPVTASLSVTHSTNTNCLLVKIKV